MMTEEIITVLMRQGFKQFVLVSGHGGANWMSSCIKHLNHKYSDILAVHAHANMELAWRSASEATGFMNNNEIRWSVWIMYCPLPMS